MPTIAKTQTHPYPPDSSAIIELCETDWLWDIVGVLVVSLEGDRDFALDVEGEGDGGIDWDADAELETDWDTTEFDPEGVRDGEIEDVCDVDGDSSCSLDGDRDCVTDCVDDGVYDAEVENDEAEDGCIVVGDVLEDEDSEGEGFGLADGSGVGVEGW